MKIKGSNVTIMVGSLSKAIKFYTSILDMKLLVQHGSHWAEVGTKGLVIGLHPKRKEKIAFGNNASIGLEVADIVAAVSELKEHGIECSIVKDSYVHLAHFKDPDGNALYFYKGK
jgi:catechol 2,3-dioxygenase-like lactoylglutathione lyase family enzyme